MVRTPDHGRNVGLRWFSVMEDVPTTETNALLLLANSLYGGRLANAVSPVYKLTSMHIVKALTLLYICILQFLKYTLMKKIILLGLMFSAILASCSKNSVDQPTNPNPPSASQQDSAKYILIATRDQTLTTTLSCYNADKTLRWKKDSLGNAGHPGVLFGNGHIYYLVGYWDFTLGSSYNNFYSIEPSTGKIVWSILKSREHIVGLTLRNDTLFWAVQSNNSNYLAAYNANNGNLIWKSVLPAQGGPENLKIDGNMIYYFSAPLDISTNYINAFDITTKTVKWQHNVGPSIGNYPGIIAILGNILCFKNGTGALYAFDKNTGTVVWTKPGPDYNTPMVGNGVFYSMGPGYKLYEINSTNGNVISEIATGLYFTES
ncbi:hypothetical protein BH11BAC5_BH11BAC5_42560 [soil metagenome]